MCVCVCLSASDLERSVEGLQKNLSVNKGLVTEQEVEKKSMELRRLGETLTELKSQCNPILLPASGLHGGDLFYIYKSPWRRLGCKSSSRSRSPAARLRT